MRDRDRLLRGLALLMPREFRERVFEPALSDIRLDEATNRRPLARLVLVLECVRLGVPLYFWRKGRPTIVTVTLVALLVAGVLVRARWRYAAEWRAQVTTNGQRR